MAIKLIRYFYLLCCLLFVPFVYGGVLIGSGVVDSVDWGSVTFFLNAEGTFTDAAGTYEMAASEYSAGDDEGAEGTGETLDFTAGAKKIGDKGLYATTVDDIIIFDAASIITSGEYKIGFWFQVPTSWDDSSDCFVIGDSDDFISIQQEITGDKELQFRHYTNSGTNISETSSTTMSTGTWYWVEMAAKASTEYFYWSISESTHEDIGTDTPSVTVDTFDTEPGVGDIKLGLYVSGAAVFYIDNFMISSDSTEDLYALRNETARP